MQRPDGAVKPKNRQKRFAFAGIFVFGKASGTPVPTGAASAGFSG